MEICYKEKEAKIGASLEERVKTLTDLLDNINMRVEDLRLREATVKTCMQAIEDHMLNIDQFSYRSADVLYNLELHLLGGHTQASESPRHRMAGPRASELYSMRSMSIDDSHSHYAASSGFMGQHRGVYNEAKLVPFTDYRRQTSKIMSADIVDADSEPSRIHLGVDARQRSSTFSDPKSLRRIKEAREDIERDVDTDRFFEGERRGDAMPRSQFMGLSKRRGFNLTKPLLHVSPLTPIVTKNQTEYSSITDDIDTSSINNCSPPGTPFSRTPSVSIKQRKAKRKVRNNDQLNIVEELENERMKKLVHTRIRQLSLTESDSYANLVKHALETLEDNTKEVDEEDQHSVEEECDVTVIEKTSCPIYNQQVSDDADSSNAGEPLLGKGRGTYSVDFGNAEGIELRFVDEATQLRGQCSSDSAGVKSDDGLNVFLSDNHQDESEC